MVQPDAGVAARGRGLAGLTWRAGPQVKQLLQTRKPGPGGLWDLPLFGAMTTAVSLVVFLFYVWRTNNYGGFTSGPRWLFWLIPLWLLGTLPAADWIGRYRIGRVVGGGAARVLGAVGLLPGLEPVAAAVDPATDAS